MVSASNVPEFASAEQTYDGIVEGEVDSFDFRASTARLLLASGTRISFNYPPGRSQAIVDAASAGPLHKIRIEGIISEAGGESKIVKINRLDVEEEARAAEIEEDVVARLEELQSLEEGWLDGEGQKISEVAIETAAIVLKRALIAFPDLPTPDLGPAADGRVMAAWFQENGWSATIVFGEALTVWAASHADGRKPLTGTGQLSRHDAGAAISWLRQLSGLSAVS